MKTILVKFIKACPDQTGMTAKGKVFTAHPTDELIKAQTMEFPVDDAGNPIMPDIITEGHQAYMWMPFEGAYGDGPMTFPSESYIESTWRQI